nr:MAG: putative maturation protein [Leviviridae sp.]
MGNKNHTLIHYKRGRAQQWDNSYVQKSYRYTSVMFDRQGTNSPNFRSKIKKGVSATNLLVCKWQNVRYEPGYIKAVWVSKSYNPERYGRVITTNITDNWAPTVHTSLPNVNFRASVANAALIGLIKKIRKAETSDLAGPTFVGELRETVAMIKDPLRTLRTKLGLFTDLQMRILRDKQARGRRFKPYKWTQVLSETYLEWAFGAAPLIADIGAIADVYLEKKLRAFPNQGLRRLSSKFSDSYSGTEPTGYNLGWSGTGIYVKVHFAKRYESSAMYVCWLDNDLVFADQAMANLRNMAKFRLDEIIPTAWELMPWSFLIDYFTNIGDVLGCTFDFRRNVRFAKFTELNSCKVTHAGFTPVSAEPSVYTVLDFKPHTFESVYTECRRSDVSQLAFPQLDVSLPSLGQGINILALVTALRNNNPFHGFSIK